MAARKRQLQSAEQNNGKTSATKVSHKSKQHAKGKSKYEDTSKQQSYSILYKICLIAAAIAVGFIHRNHISGMFERDRHFSHLSTLERELAFRTEMGLYYSYYKTMIESKTFLDGLNQIMYDNVTEYPQTINTLKRFNLYPEVVLAIGYRIYEGVNEYFKRPTKMCWTVNRGENLSPVQSCEGLGEPSYFYIEPIFLLNGIMMSVFFLFGVYLRRWLEAPRLACSFAGCVVQCLVDMNVTSAILTCGSLFGGVLTVVSFFYNHGECTRVMWTPPLRESFAFPFLVIQMFLVTYLLRTPSPSYRHSVFIAVATVSFMLPWQFAQFALLTETVAVFATYVLGYIGSYKMKIFLAGQVAGFLVGYLLLFGNEMLLTSFFCSSLITISIIVLLEPFLEKLKTRVIIWAVQGLLLAAGTVGIKLLLALVFSIRDDAHIGDIFKSKFTDFKNFHTMLYTCSAEFDFIEKATPWRLTVTLLLPCALVVMVTVIYHLLRTELNSKEEESENTAFDRQHRSKPNAEIVFHIFQLLAFTMMAVMIMRLKLFWTPHLCLFISLLASQQFFGWIGNKERHYAILTVIIACMSYGGISNLTHQWSILGEFSNVPQEELVEWIKAMTPKTAVFAGPMPTMATVKLCTGRPIVNHPHYEDAGLRERTHKVYMMYSRKPASEIHQNLKDLKVDYTVLEDSWCVRRTKPGCLMAEIFDIEDTENREKPPVCSILKDNPEPYFKRVFKNNVYQVLKVL